MKTSRSLAITFTITLAGCMAMAHAQEPQRPTRPTTAPLAAPPARPAPANRRDHRVDETRAIDAVAIFREWVIGANRSGQIDVALNPFAPATARYSLKGLEKRKFLEQAPGSRVRWTQSASIEDAREAGHWAVYAQSQGVEDLGSGQSVRSRPLRYGERVALVWQPFQGTGGKPDALMELTSARTALLLFKRQSTGQLQYDWAIVGGKKGTAVRMGTDRVVLFNISRGQPLIYYPREKGFPDYLGWPDMTAKATPELDPGKHTQLDKDVWDALLL